MKFHYPKLLLKWKNELEKFDNEQIDIINKLITDVSDKELSDYGRKSMLKTIKKFGIEEVIECTRISISQYLKDDNNNVVKVLDYIPRICGARKTAKENPLFSKSNYIKGIMRNRFGIFSDKRVAIAFKELITTREDVEIIIDIAKQATNWTNFWEWLNETYDTNY